MTTSACSGMPDISTRSLPLLCSLKLAHSRARSVMNSMLQRTKKLLEQPESGAHAPKGDESDVEQASMASTAIEDAMTFCAADEVACSQYASDTGNFSAIEYHKMLIQKLGASLSTDGQSGGNTVVIRSPRQDPHLQNGINGTRAMSGARVEASELAGRSPKDKKPATIHVSRNQLTIALILGLSAILIAVLITYTIAKESINRSSCSFANASSLGGLVPNYQDQFDTPHKLQPHKLPDLETKPQSSNDTDGAPTAKELRLLQDLVPIFYNLSMKVYLPGFISLPKEKNMTFDAALIIKFRVANPTDKIELSSMNLRFTNKLDVYQLTQNAKRNERTVANLTNDQALIVSSNGTRPVSSADVALESDAMGMSSRVDAGIHVTGISVNETLEKVVFHLNGQLQKDHEYYFNIPYSGPIDLKLSGLYLTTYTDANGQQKYAAVTQMEPTDARKLVPCFDEPAIKAVWRLRVLHPVGSRAVGNSIEERQDEPTSDPNWLLTTFEETLPMSSYLLALFISEFEYVEGKTKNNVRFRIWARKEALNETEYALQAGIKCLEFYEDFYGIPFPLAKQDMVALPDFSAGAMENWGLITYREKYLLYSPELYSSRQKLHVATVVAHELAHQWFGNLVTMQWWNDLWLNEGFATLMEYAGTSAISGNKFRMDQYFIIDALSNAFDRDARATSHPLVFDISKAEDVSEAFDSITYDKGGSVLRMIEEIMGKDNFRKGLKIYLNRFKFKNAEHKDLWNALSEAVPSTLKDWSGEKFDVNEFAKLWTRQMGYPVIQVKRLDTHRVELSQRRFKLDEDAVESLKFRNAKYWYKWDVPVWYSVNGSEKEMIWLHENAILDVGEDESLVVNTDSRGFYRVQYSKKTLDNINNVLMTNHQEISVKSRARIIDDTFTLAQAGKLSYESALNLTFYLNKETEYLPWFSALAGLDTIQYYFGDEPELTEVREYIKSLISPFYDKISWESINSTYLDDNHFFENLLQFAILGKMCLNRVTDCTEKLSSIYYNNFVYPCQNTQKQASQCSSVPIPLRGLAYCEGIRTGSDKDWEKMLEMYQRETVQIERERLLAALTCSRDPHILKTLLAMTIDFNNTLIRLQDKPGVFDTVSSQEPIGQSIALEFFLDHWPQIYKDFKDQQTLLRGIIVGAIGGTSTRTIEQVEKFLKQNQKTTKNLDVFKQRLEVLYTNRKWIDANLKTMSEWFKEQNKARRKQQLS